MLHGLERSVYRGGDFFWGSVVGWVLMISIPQVPMTLRVPRPWYTIPSYHIELAQAHGTALRLRSKAEYGLSAGIAASIESYRCAAGISAIALRWPWARFRGF